MENNFQKKIIVLAVVLAIIPIGVISLVFGLSKYYFTPARNIENSWNIEIPDDFVEIYHVSSDDFWSRSDNYTVYTTVEKNIAFLSGFTITPNTEIEKFAHDISNNLSVEKDYRLSFDQKYYYLQKSRGEDTITIMYFPQTRQYVFVESFSWDG